ncbi:hypothetical protein NKG05_14010 [Oerskovia sp. M15]
MQSTVVADLVKGEPIAEVERRARIVSILCRIAPARVGGAVRYGWENGGGEHAAWYFLPDGRALLLVADHISPLNQYAEWDVVAQRSYLDGLPEDLLAVALAQCEDDLVLTITSDDDAVSVPFATGVFWFDGEHWRVAAGLQRHCTEHDIDLWDESGFGLCTGDLRLGRPFTRESVLAVRGTAVSDGWSDEAVLAAFADDDTGRSEK